MRLSPLLLALALWPALSVAQESSAVLAATTYAREQAASLSPADLGDLHAGQVSVDRASGTTLVHLVQRHNGIEIYGATWPTMVTAAGEVVAMPNASRFESGLGARANGAEPSLDATQAYARAAAHVRTLRPETEMTRLADDPATDVRPERSYVPLGEARLVYQPTASGAIRLAWAVVLEGLGSDEMWAARVDAVTGTVLAADDLVARHTVTRNEALARPSFAPLAGPAMDWSATAGGYQYRVLPMPIETPNHGNFQLIANPHNVTASPLGWHNTGSVTFDHTRGNNAWAYEDRANTTSGTGTGAGVALPTAPLTYNHVFDPNRAPVDNVDAAIVNLFYWGNVTHDLLWHYGFNEASGNFQVNNFGLGGNGNDPVRLEAQDGSGTNNANFSTPPDGSSGRMQMFEWSAVPQVDLLSPPDVAGNYPSRGGAFGAGVGVYTANAILALTAGGDLSRGCAAGDIGNAGDAVGQVLFIQRGDCNFVAKARVAQALGASGVVIHNCTPGSAGCSTSSPGEGLITMACPDGDNCSDVTIPAAFVQESTALTIAGASATPVARLTISADRDSDFDAGVIVHEYGHGVSNRLVDLPTNTGCLGNQEQMGEGWSDYFGMMMTQRAGDTGAQRRGVGTYLQFEPTDGIGIRNAPYSTDFAINDYTYQTLINQGGTGLSIPHGVGFVWATMLWEMTWELIGAHGFSPDFYNATGTAGNQIALRLVTQGLELTPCNPGFVDGRDAILAADQAFYGGANRDLIWAAFARRGLGQGASQGSSASVNDGTASFVAPVAQEAGPDGSVVRLVVAGANPFRGATQMELTLDRAQTVRVTVVDLLGRTVATLHDGALAVGSHTLDVSARGFAPGSYVVRAVAEDVALSERITVLR